MRPSRGGRRGGLAALLAAVAISTAAGCAPPVRGPAASPRPETGAAPAPAPPAPRSPSCAALSDRAAVEAICAQDAIASLNARFRARVELDGTTREAEGVLLLQRPGALRTKLFTLGGLTVYDALWVGGGDEVRGDVSSPLGGGAPTRHRLRPGDALADAGAGLSLALWTLWQPRCAAPPVADPGQPGVYVLDPRSGQAVRRTVRVADGFVVEEIVARPGAAGEERIVARFAADDCDLPVPLPREIEIGARAWTARVRIVAVEEDAVFDPRLFEMPPAGTSDAAD